MLFFSQKISLPVLLLSLPCTQRFAQGSPSVHFVQLNIVALIQAVCYTRDGGVRMGQKEKLIARLKTIPRDFTFEEAESLLGYLTFHRSNKGKTSGSRVMFVSDEYRLKILLHKPHPRKELLEYQVRQLIEQLEKEGFI